MDPTKISKKLASPCQFIFDGTVSHKKHHYICPVGKTTSWLAIKNTN